MSIREEVRRFLGEAFYAPADLDDEAPLIDRGIVDSRGVVELVSFLETEFGIVISDREINPENLESVRRIVAFVEDKRGEGSVKVPASEQVAR